MASDPSAILKISALGHDGRGIGFLPASQVGKRGMAVFVPGALPGEKIVCGFVKIAGNFIEGVKLDTLDTPFGNSENICSHVHDCGGCPLMRMPYQKQLEWKERLFFDALCRIGKMPEVELRSIWQGLSPSPLLSNFRNKLTLAFGLTKAGNPALGFRQRGSHNIIPITNCLLITPQNQEIFAAMGKLALESGLPFYNRQGFWRFFTIRKAGTLANSQKQWHGLLVTSAGNAAQRKMARLAAEKLLAQFPMLSSMAIMERKCSDFLSDGQKLVFSAWQGGQKDTLAMECQNKIFELGINSFYQVNDKAGQELANIVVELDRNTSGPLLDLYCGVGAPGQLLGANHESAFGIEANIDSIAYARANAVRNVLPAFRYQSGDVYKVLATKFAGHEGCNFTTVLADPPRAGIARNAMEKILALNPNHILYISCNPVTLGRDAQFLNHTYSLKLAASVDMFPHTQHIESCVLWEKRAAPKKCEILCEKLFDKVRAIV